MKDAENIYKILMEHAGLAVMVFEVEKDADGNVTAFKILDANKNMEANAGVPAGNMIGKSFHEVFPEYYEELKEKFFKAAADHKNKHFEVNHKGHTLTILPCLLPDNRFACIFENISVRKEFETELVMMTTLVEASSEAIIVTDPEGIIQFVNPAFETITGYSRAEVKGKSIRILESGEHSEEFQKSLWDTISAGKIWKGELIDRKKDGSFFEMQVTISPISDQNGNIIGYVSCERDITRERELEKQLNQAHKMQAMGTLAGGIAHDFNNILMGILGYTEIGLEETEKDSPEHESFQQIFGAGIRAKDLVKQILSFARSSKKKKAPVQVSIMVREILKFIESTVPSNIELKKNIKTHSSTLGDPTMIHQILMNLCSNAAYAMRDTGGTLDILLEDFNLTMEDAHNFADIKPGPYIKLTVNDTGKGIPPKIINKIFDPFFTTKPVGEATGMGLSVVRNSVKDLNGEIKVASTVGKGSTFTVFIPRLEMHEGSQLSEKSHLPGGSGEKVLFVDDEILLAELMEKMLSKLKYKVDTFNKPEEALAAFRKAPADYSLVITDQTMPGMPGSSLAKEILALRPDIPVFLCTGYSNALNKDQILAIGIKDILVKPVSMKDLAETLSKYIGKH